MAPRVRSRRSPVLSMIRQAASAIWYAPAFIDRCRARLLLAGHHREGETSMIKPAAELPVDPENNLAYPRRRRDFALGDDRFSQDFLV